MSPPSDTHKPVERPAASPGRRRLLTLLSLGLSAVGAALVAVPTLAFSVAPMFRKRPKIWRKVGAADSFVVGQTVSVQFEDASPLPWAGASARTGAWLRRVSEDEFVAFALYCTHLGCPVQWKAEAGLFMCPCHGGVYYRTGEVAGGPPPRPLQRYPVRVRDKQVEISPERLPIG